jgi:hypothetical protein
MVFPVAIASCSHPIVTKQQVKAHRVEVSNHIQKAKLSKTVTEQLHHEDRVLYHLRTLDIAYLHRWIKTESGTF